MTSGLAALLTSYIPSRFAAPSPLASEGASPSQLLDRARLYEDADAFEVAVANYERVVDSSTAQANERALALIGLARIRSKQADWDLAIERTAAAERVARDEAHDLDLAAEAMNVRVGVAWQTGEFDLGDQVATEALTIASKPRIRGLLFGQRANIAAHRGDYGAARDGYAAATEAFREAGYELGVAQAYVSLSEMLLREGQPDAALERAAAAESMAIRLAAEWLRTVAVENQADALVSLGRPAEAHGLIVAALGHFIATRQMRRQVELYALLGKFFAAFGPEYRTEAIKCYELARSLGEKAGAAPLVERINATLAELATADRQTQS